jgi:hypothetical protein
MSEADLRVNEARSLDLDDIKWDLGRFGKLHVRHGKGARGSGPRERIVPLINDAGRTLRWFMFPVLSDVRRQVEGVQPGVVPLDVSPEQACEGPGETGNRAVIQPRPAFIEVADQHIVNRLALELVVAHQLLGRPLAAEQGRAERDVCRQHSDALEEVPGGVDTTVSAAQSAVKPFAILIDVLSRKLINVPTGVQHQLADGEQSVEHLRSLHALLITDLLHAGEEIRAKHPAHPLEQRLGFVSGKEVIARQHRPAQQQVTQSVYHLGALGRGCARVGGDDLIQPSSVTIRAGGHPAFLPAITGMPLQPPQDRRRSSQSRSSFALRDLGPDRQGGNERHDVLNRQMINRPDMQLSGPSRCDHGASAPGRRLNIGRRGHCGFPPNSTDRSLLS